MLAIRHLPAMERPRERCQQLGPRVLSSVELMAIVVGSGSEGRSAMQVGSDLLGACRGSLQDMASRPIPYLTKVCGVGPARAVTVHAALELGRRMMLEKMDLGAHALNGYDLYNYFAGRMSDLPVEELHVMVTDTQFRVRGDITVTRGTLNSTAVHPREIFRHAIADNAYAVVLVHNHPSGDPTPSEADIQFTYEIQQAGNLLGIMVVDHVIIGRGRFFSFAQQRIFH